MTDLQETKRFLEKYRIGHTEAKSANNTKLQCIQGLNNVGGHYGLYATFEFNEAGKFLGFNLYDELGQRKIKEVH